MYKFDHPNVLSLMGVCLDGGTVPYIIVPFMANGSLLAYLRSNRKRLTISNEENNEEEVCSLLLTSLEGHGHHYLAFSPVYKLGCGW